MENCIAKYVGQCDYEFNTFSNLKECYEACRDSTRKEIKGNITAKIFCRLQPDFGRCNSYHPMWYFDLTSRTCRGFSYSGCGGNMNRFPSQQDCVTSCGSYVTF
ncbi:unnamed protein product [Colias eurytheme]|nr:unnamed protein product [Colias eurytheme]